MRILSAGLICVSLVFSLQAAFAEQCPRAVGIKATKEFVRRREARCFASAKAAESAGYQQFSPSTTPTPGPTATATPAYSNFSGSWGTAAGSPLAVTSDTCQAIGFSAAATRVVSIDVEHDYISGWVVAADNLDANKPFRMWGTGATSSPAAFGVADVNISTESCSAGHNCCANPIVTTTFSFTSVTANSASLAVTDSINCIGLANFPCQRKWGGTVTK